MHHEGLGEFDLEDGFAELEPIGDDGEIDVAIDAGERDPTKVELDGLANACRSHPQWTEKGLAHLRQSHLALLGDAFEVWSEDIPGFLQHFNPDAKAVADLTGEQVAAQMGLGEIRLEVDDPSQIVFDLRFKPEEMDYLVCARFDLLGNLDGVALES